MGNQRQFHANQSSLPRHVIDQLGVRQFILAEWGSKPLVHRTCECPERNGACKSTKGISHTYSATHANTARTHWILLAR